jgi:hypothetical protein
LMIGRKPQLSVSRSVPKPPHLAPPTVTAVNV